MNDLMMPEAEDEPCDCEETLRHLDAFLDHEVDDELTIKLTKHVDECDYCGQVADAEVHLRKLVKSGCVEKAPAELRARLLSQFALQGAASDASRGRR